MVNHLKGGDAIKLWAAFAQLGMEDPPTAAAALGCLAMAVRDPEVKTAAVLLRQWYTSVGVGDDVGCCHASGNLVSKF